MTSLSVISKFIEYTDFFASNIKHTTFYCNDSKPYFATGSMVRIDISKTNATINILLGNDVFKIKKTDGAYIEVFKRHLRNCRKFQTNILGAAVQEKSNG
jgi:hypothetical protein